MTRASGERQSAEASVRSFLACERGATSIEYSLIVGLIFLVIVAAVRNFTASTSDMYSTINSALP